MSVHNNGIVNRSTKVSLFILRHNENGIVSQCMRMYTYIRNTIFEGSELITECITLIQIALITALNKHSS